MSKPNELVYDKFLGLNVQEPPNKIGREFSPAMSNFWVRNNTLQSRPIFRGPISPPNAGPGAPTQLAGIASFFDNTGALHTVCWIPGAVIAQQLWQLNTANVWVAIAFAGGVSILDSNNPISWRVFGGVLYFTNGGTGVGLWDGITATWSQLNTNVGGNSVGGVYLGEMNNSLILASTVENPGPVSFTNRIRWSANGLPAVWDPAVNISAGSNDFLDVPDAITGFTTMGSSVGYILRTNGVTEQTVSGNVALPFNWNHLWGEQRGVGNVYPGTLDTYGSFGFFVDFENIYQFSVYSFEPIGGKARDAITTDLASAISQVLFNNISNVPTQILGGICDQMVNGIVYLTYMLAIPLTGGTRVWVYSLEDKTWTPFFVSNYYLTAKPNRIWID